MPRNEKPKTFRDVYEPAMEIKTRKEANRYLKRTVRLLQKQRPGLSTQDATTQVKANLGYYAGYYDHETRLRVEDLFGCEHPYLGKAIPNEPVTPERALARGIEIGQALRRRHQAEM